MIESIQYQHFNFKFIIHIPYFLFLFHLSSYSYHSLQTNSFSYINTIPISIILSYHLYTKIIHQSHLGVHWSSLSVHLGPLGLHLVFTQCSSYTSYTLLSHFKLSISSFTTNMLYLNHNLSIDYAFILLYLLSTFQIS